MIIAARYLGVAPWDLHERGKAWADWAISARNAEARAEAFANRRAEQRARRQRGG